MANPIIKMFASLNAAVYKATNGRWMGKMGKSDICVVRMQGARTGIWRDVPLMYVPNGDGVILVASLGGAPKNPVWFYNLVAHPDIEVLLTASLEPVDFRKEDIDGVATNDIDGTNKRKGGYRRPWSATVFHVSQTDPI